MFEVGQRVVRTESWDQQGIFAGDEGTVVDVSGLERSVPVIRVKFDGKGVRTVLASKMEPRHYCEVRQRPCDFVVDFGPDLGMFIRDGMSAKQARAALANPPHLLDERIKEAFKHLRKVKLRASDPRNHVQIVRRHVAPEHFRWLGADPTAIVIWGKP